MKNLSTMILCLTATALMTSGCEAGDLTAAETNADLGGALAATVASPMNTMATTPLHFEGDAQFWWETDFVSSPSCDAGLLNQTIDLRVKLGKLAGTAPVPHSIVVTSLNVDTWEMTLLTTVGIDESELRANDGQLRMDVAIDMKEEGLECGSPANLLMVQAIGDAGYGRTLDQVGMTALSTFGCEPLSSGFADGTIECNSSCGAKERSRGLLCTDSFVPETIDVYFYDLKQGQLLVGLSTELEWTDEPSLGSVTATNSWRGAAATTSAHQMKVIIARDADGEILSVLGV